MWGIGVQPAPTPTLVGALSYFSLVLLRLFADLNCSATFAIVAQNNEACMSFVEEEADARGTMCVPYTRVKRVDSINSRMQAGLAVVQPYLPSCTLPKTI